MDNLYVIAGFLIAITVIGLVINVLIDRRDTDKGKREVPIYKYRRRNYFLTKTEKEFYDSLTLAIGQECRVFPQVHLSSILDHEVKGQSWKGALSHIQRKSVDFLVCDNTYLSPKLVIELDDPSHERSDRKERDGIVEKILNEAGVPLLRLRHNEPWNMEQVVSKIKESL